MRLFGPWSAGPPSESSDGLTNLRGLRVRFVRRSPDLCMDTTGGMLQDHSMEKFIDELTPADWLEYEWYDATAGGDRTMKVVRGHRRPDDAQGRAAASFRMLQIKAQYPAAFEGRDVNGLPLA